MKSAFTKVAIGLSLVLGMALVSCEELGILSESVGVTDEDVINGLRQALEVGTDTAVSHLNVQDGFYKDELVKILLPAEAQPVYDILNLLPSGIVDETILSINRAAEDAAKEAGLDVVIDACILIEHKRWQRE